MLLIFINTFMDTYTNQLINQILSLQEELQIADEIIDSLTEDTELQESFLMEKKKWIQDAIKKPGALRKSMKVKEGQDIPVNKLKKAAEKGGKTGKRAQLALTLRSLKK